MLTVINKSILAQLRHFFNTGHKLTGAFKLALAHPQTKNNQTISQAFRQAFTGKGEK